MARAKRLSAPAEPIEAGKVLSAYSRWLGRQPLAKRSRSTYLAQVTSYVEWLDGGEHGAGALTDLAVRDWAVRDYKRHLKTKRKLKPTSVNQALAAIDNFYRHLGVGRPDVKREDLPQVAPKGLDVDEQRAFLRTTERSSSVRDRAIATTFFYAGLRLSELGALDLDDVSISARRGQLTVRSGKGDMHREVPLNSACRLALQAWIETRNNSSSTPTTAIPPQRCGCLARGPA